MARGSFALSQALLLSLVTGCASGPLFQRPEAKGTPTITDAASGRTWTDCRQAFQQAQGDTVLLFSEGVFQCGPEVASPADWLVLKGAGMGKTLLAASDSGPLKLTAIRPGRYLRVADLAFGGLTDQPSDEAKAELVRVAVTSERPALFGDRERGQVGSVLVVHSVLAGHGRQPGDVEPKPTPLAFNGNEKVGVVESVLLDVEQEFERFPAPGSVVLLSEGVEAPFELHEPAQKLRRQPSSRTNTACGNKKNPFVACARHGQSPDDESEVAEAARLALSGKPLAQLEPHLRAAAHGFAERFHTQLGPAIRQPDVFWFDDPSAQVLESAVEAEGAQWVALYAKAHAGEVAAACGQPDVPTRQAMERARALDKLLPEPQVAAACAKALEPRTQTLLQECQEGWEWDRTLDQIAQADLALGDGSAQAKACREKLKGRLEALLQQGGLAKSYLLQVNRQLDLAASPGAGEAKTTTDAVVAALPWIVTKTGRSIPFPAQPTLLDRLVKAAQAPNSGDGRRLVEVTGPCQLVPVTPGSPQMKALGRVQLAEERAGSEEPDLKLELPVEATRGDIDSGTPAGGVNMALIKKCDEKIAQAYPTAVGRYVGEELERLARSKGPAALDAELALHLVRGSAQAPELKVRPAQLPVVRPALLKIADDLARGAGTLQPVAAAGQTPAPQTASTLLQDAATKRPPTWTMAELTRAADILSRAGLVAVESCAFLLPEVPWQPVEGGISGQVVLEDVPATVRCRPDARGFELAVWVEGEPGKRIRVMGALERALTARLGAPMQQQTQAGPALAWPYSAKTRTAFVYRSLPSAASMLGYILVPLGSNWTK